MNAHAPQDFAPPHSIEAEQALLGAILNCSAAFDSAEPHVAAADFSEPCHGHLFERFAAARREGSAITPILAALWLGETGSADIGGMTLNQYVARLAAEAITISGAADYAKQVRECANQRRLADIARVLLDAARGDQKVRDIATAAIEQLDEIACSAAGKSSSRVSIGDAALDAIAALENRLQNPGKLPGISCGFSRRLDERIGGFRRDDLIVLAGRPGMGKSAVAVLSASKSALAGRPALFFSLEMNAASLASRTAVALCYGSPRDRFTYSEIEHGKVNAEQADRFVNAARDLAAANLEIDEAAGLSIGQIAARARRHQQRLAQRGLTLGSIWVDHIGLVRASQRYAGNRVHEIGEISGALKALAKDLGVPVIALSQLNRSVETRDNKRPTLSDLRDSGTIEQDADVVLLAYRPAYYLELPIDDPHKDAERKVALDGCGNALELHVAKNRHGQVGTINLFCDIGCNYVADIEKGDAL
jgi:replicative DNA helicase